MFSIPDIAVVLGVALLVFGPSKLPDIGKSLGKGIRDFKKAVEEEPAKDMVTKPEQKLIGPDQGQANKEG